MRDAILSGYQDNNFLVKYSDKVNLPATIFGVYIILIMVLM